MLTKKICTILSNLQDTRCVIYWSPRDISLEDQTLTNEDCYCIGRISKPTLGEKLEFEILELLNIYNYHGIDYYI